jgi:hypothetical protein
MNADKANEDATEGESPSYIDILLLLLLYLTPIS